MMMIDGAAHKKTMRFEGLVKWHIRQGMYIL